VNITDVVIGLGGIVIGAIVASAYFKSKIVDLANLIKASIPGDTVEPELGKALEMLGRVLQNKPIDDLTEGNSE